MTGQRFLFFFASSFETEKKALILYGNIRRGLSRDTPAENRRFELNSAISEPRVQKTNPFSALFASYKDKMRLPSFAGILEVVHTLPGRIRLKIPSLKRNIVGAENFKQRITRLNGIRNVDINLFLGTVLIQYDPQLLTPTLVVAAASHCFEFQDALRNKKSILWQEVKNFRFAIDQALLRNSAGIVDLRAAMTLALAISLIRGLSRHGQGQFTPLNIIWWLFQSIDR